MTTQSEYEKAHGLVARADCMEHLTVLFSKLDDKNFHSLYDLAWTLATKELLRKIAKDEISDLKVKLAKGADE